MATLQYIVFGTDDPSYVAIKADDNTFTGTNTFSGAVVLSGALSGTSVKDEDNMASDSDTAVPTQQSTKAYADTKVAKTGDTMTGDLTLEGELKRSKYAEMYVSEEADATVIVTANVYQPIYPNASASSLVSGFTFSQGVTQAITAAAEIDPDNVRFTSNAHGMSAGDMITIRGTTSYNGHYIVDTVDTNTFDVEVTWVADEAGTLMKPDQFTVNSGTSGVKRNYFSLTGNSAGAAKDYTFTFLVYDKTTEAFIECPKCTKAVRTQLASEKFSLAATTLRNWAEGDRIAIVVKCADTTNLTVNNLDFNIL